MPYAVRKRALMPSNAEVVGPGLILVANPDVTSAILAGWTIVRQYDTGRVLMRLQDGYELPKEAER